MVSEPKKKVWAVGNLHPMGDDPKAFPQEDYLAHAEKKPRSLRSWVAISVVVALTLLGILAIYFVARRLDYLGHH